MTCAHDSTRGDLIGLCSCVVVVALVVAEKERLIVLFFCLYVCSLILLACAHDPARVDFFLEDKLESVKEITINRVDARSCVVVVSLLQKERAIACFFLSIV